MEETKNKLSLKEKRALIKEKKAMLEEKKVKIVAASEDAKMINLKVAELDGVARMIGHAVCFKILQWKDDLERAE